jgi:hypothetical protein
MLNTINVRGSILQTDARVLLTNKTGGALVKGSVVVLDLTKVTATTLLEVQDFVKLWATGKPALVFIAADSIADGAVGPFIPGRAEGTLCLVEVDSTTDIAVGDQLKLVTGVDHLVKATAGTDPYCAIALEARTSNDQGNIAAVVFNRCVVAIH